MTSKGKVLNKKVKKVSLAVAQNYPQYLNSTCILLNTKKLIIGVSTTFEIKALLANERRAGFVEFDKEALLFLLSSLETIREKFNETAKYKQNLSSRLQLRIFLKNYVYRVSIKDIVTGGHIIFSWEEFNKLCEFQYLLIHQFLKLTMNLPAIVTLYHKFIEKCFENNILDISTFEVSTIGSTENATNLDFIRTLYEFYPILGAAKIRRDIEMYSITNLKE
jgi:hypothetical protein